MTFQVRPVRITGIDNDLIRYVYNERRGLPGIAPRFDWRAARSLVLREIAQQVIELPIASPVLDEIRAREEFLSDEVADVLNWLSEQPIVVRNAPRKAQPPRCRRCHRVLTDPESIARGLGPECAALEGRTGASRPRTTVAIQP